MLPPMAILRVIHDFGCNTARNAEIIFKKLAFPLKTAAFEGDKPNIISIIYNARMTDGIYPVTCD